MQFFLKKIRSVLDFRRGFFFISLFGHIDCLSYFLRSSSTYSRMSEKIGKAFDVAYGIIGTFMRSKDMVEPEP